MECHPRPARGKSEHDMVGPGAGAHCIVHYRCDEQALGRNGGWSPRPWCHGILPALQHEGRLEQQAHQRCRGQQWRTEKAEHKATG